jgi:cysteine-S-conjugate beta-lyase
VVTTPPPRQPHDSRFDEIDLTVLRSAHSTKWTEHGPDVLPAWIADMDFPIAAPIQAAIDSYVNEQFIGYPGRPFANRVTSAYANWSADRYGLLLDQQNMVVLTEVVQGINVTLRAFTKPGDGVLVMTPLYPPFLEAIEEQQRTLVDYRITLQNGQWAIDWDALSLLVRTERPTMFMLCHPHNPLGRVFTREELHRIADLAEEIDAIVVSDELHGELCFAPNVHIPFLALGNQVAKRTITLNSASKAFNTAGMRCAVLHYGTAELKERAQQELGSHHLLGVPATIGMLVTEAAWQHGSQWLSDCVSYLHNNATYVYERFSAMSLTVAPNQATYLQWLDFSPNLAVMARLHADPAICVSDLLRTEAKVALNHGPTFGTNLAHCARLNFGTSRTIAANLCDRIEAWLALQ